MASIIIKTVEVLDNPGMFLGDFRFEITFECVAPIAEGEWCPGGAGRIAGDGLVAASGRHVSKLAGQQSDREELGMCRAYRRLHRSTTRSPARSPPHFLANVRRRPTSATEIHGNDRSLPTRPADLEWRVVYVGSASSSKHDQELDCVLVGPVPLGMSKFVLQARERMGG